MRPTRHRNGRLSNNGRPVCTAARPGEGWSLSLPAPRSNTSGVEVKSAAWFAVAAGLSRRRKARVWPWSQSPRRLSLRSPLPESRPKLNLEDDLGFALAESFPLAERAPRRSATLAPATRHSETSPFLHPHGCSSTAPSAVSDIFGSTHPHWIPLVPARRPLSHSVGLLKQPRPRQSHPSEPGPMEIAH